MIFPLLHLDVEFIDCFIDELRIFSMLILSAAVAVFIIFVDIFIIRLACVAIMFLSLRAALRIYFGVVLIPLSE